MGSLDLSRLDFHRPGLLWLLLGVVLFFFMRAWAVQGRVGGDRVGSFLSMWARIAAYASLCLAAAGPFTLEDRPDLAVAMVVDASGSSGGGRLEKMLDQVEAFWKAWPGGNGEDRPALILGGGSTVRTFASPQAMREAASPSPLSEGTDLFTPLEEALRVIPKARSRQVLLFSDGASTRGALDRVAALAQARDIRISPLPPDSGRLGVAVSGVSATQQARVGEDISVSVTLEANAPFQGRLDLLGVGNKELASTPVTGGPGAQEVSLTFVAPSPPGILSLRARVEVKGDLFAEDDVFPALVRVQGPPRALLVGEGALAAPLREALASANPKVLVEVAPRSRRPPFTDTDLVVLLDPDVPSWGVEAARELRAWVAGGGRLLVTGGSHGLVVDRPGSEPFAEMLPLRFPETEKEEPAPLSVIYCVDRSDSMARYAKFEIALSAVVASLDLLAPEAEVGVLTFSDFPVWAVPLTPASRKQEILDKLASLKVHGGTSIYPALEAAADVLRPSKALVRHMVLLTDGRSSTVYERHGSVVDSLKPAGITLSTVAISKEADTVQLEKIATVGGGRYYYTEDFASLPRILMDETMKVMRTNKVEERFRVLPVEDSRFLSGVNLKNIPDLLGYVRSRQKAGSELALATSRGEPLLAGWRFGRGAVTAFTSEITGPWSASWKAWPERASLFRQMIKATLVPPPPQETALTVQVHGQEARLLYSVLDGMGAPLSDLLVVGSLVRGPSTPESPLVFLPVGPGQYEASLSMEPGAAALARVWHQGKAGSTVPGLPGGERVVSVAPGPPEESRGGTVNLLALQQLAKTTSGIFSPSPSQVMNTAVDTKEVKVERWRPLLWLAFGLLLLDLALRRLRLPRREMGDPSS